MAHYVVGAPAPDPLNLRALHHELAELGFEHFESVEDKGDGLVRLVFEQPPTPEQVERAREVVDTHTGEALPHYRLHDLVSREVAKKPLTAIDYGKELRADVGRLARQETFWRGELVEVTFFERQERVQDPQTGATSMVFSGPVVRERIEYERNQFGFPLYRTKHHDYWLSSEDLSRGEWDLALKSPVKHYSEREASQETERRRKNVISQLEQSVLGLMVLSVTLEQAQAEGAENNSPANVIELGRRFVVGLQEHVTAYIHSDYSEGLEGAVTAHPGAWLDNAPAPLMGATIRQFIISEVA